MNMAPNIPVKAVAACGLHWTSRKRAALSGLPTSIVWSLLFVAPHAICRQFPLQVERNGISPIFN